MAKFTKKRNFKSTQDVSVAKKNETVKDNGGMSDGNTSDIDAESTVKRSKLSSNKDMKKSMKSAKYTKQPTSEELNRLRETENLFNSNFFRLQIEELLKEVSVKEKYVKKMNEFLLKFNLLLNSLENGVPYKLSDQSWLEDLSMQAPVVQIPPQVSGHFKFLKPASAQIVGSHFLGCSLGPHLTVDVLIKMPEGVIAKNDNLNERYFRKKALYLAVIASALKSSNLVNDLKYKLLEGCNYRPVLCFKPSGKSGKHINIILHVGSDDVFKCTRFGPSINNVRQDWRFGNSESQNNLEVATPFYNSAVVEDLNFDLNNAFLKKMIGESMNIRHGILLLKIWLRQRNIKGFSGFIMTMFVAYLVQMRRINNAMSSYQVIRNVWAALGSSEWDVQGITFVSGESSSVPSLSEFHSGHRVVFVDPSGFGNLCSRLALAEYHQVRRESLQAGTYLDDPSINAFVPLFMTPMIFHLQYDHILRLEYTKNLDDCLMQHVSDNLKLDYGADKYFLIQRVLWDLLKKGLGQRVTELTPRSLHDKAVGINVEDQAQEMRQAFEFGINLNPEMAFGSLDKGPEANMPEAEEFRKFWGKKSDLRRFQDGTISEAVFWETNGTTASKRLIVKDIICYLLQNKLGIKDKVLYVADQLESILQCRRFNPADFEYSTGEEAAMKVGLAFDGLMKNLRSLSDLPLEVNSIQGTSAILSLSAPLPPLPYCPPSVSGSSERSGHSLIRECVVRGGDKASDRAPLQCPVYLSAVHAVITLSHSGKWPDDLEALKRVKAAFYIEMCAALRNQCQLAAHARHNGIDVLKDGYLFQLEVAHRKEINLLKRSELKENGVTKMHDTDDSLETDYRLFLMPKLRMALISLNREFPSFGPACCLLERWLCCHLLDGHHFPAECAQLLVASQYLRPAPHSPSPPTQPQVTFLRALHVLAATDWNAQMIIVNFNEGFNGEDLSRLESEFSTSRTSFPAMCVVSPCDTRQPSVWSKRAPSFTVLAHTQQLARKALTIAELVMFDKLTTDAQALFTPNVEGYDVLIHLNKEFNPLKYAHKWNKNANMKKLNAYKKTDNKIIPVIDFNPVQNYLKELRSSYDEFAAFFHDTYGGDTIAILWKPAVLEWKEFKTSLLNGRKLMEKKGEMGLVTDFDAILEGCCLLGEGLVKDIENITNVSV